MRGPLNRERLSLLVQSEIHKSPTPRGEPANEPRAACERMIDGGFNKLKLRPAKLRAVPHMTINDTVYHESVTVNLCP